MGKRLLLVGPSNVATNLNQNAINDYKRVAKFSLKEPALEKRLSIYVMDAIKNCTEMKETAWCSYSCVADVVLTDNTRPWHVYLRYNCQRR